MVLFETVKDGEKALKWHNNGCYELIEGPASVTSFFTRLEKMKAFKAEPDEYLSVHYQDGRCANISGPAVEWFNPVKHSLIEVKEQMSINAHEAVVVYQENGGEVKRRIVSGPALFMPRPNEWLHKFKWHGAEEKANGRKRPGALQFLKLRVIPDQLYFDVEDVRTTDEAMLTLKLMVFFELQDIELMLDKTHDPIADFINALTADVISFAGQGNFEVFKSMTEKLNHLSAYPQLTTRAAKIGYRVNKVVYRGYKANSRLQEMHDQAIESRTSLLLQSETERQKQELEDLKLNKTIEREKLANEQEKLRIQHQLELKNTTHKNELHIQAEIREEELKFLKQKENISLEKLKNSNEQKLNLWNAMRDFGADLTQILVSENRNPDRLIAIQGTDSTQYHIHENE